MRGGALQIERAASGSHSVKSSPVSASEAREVMDIRLAADYLGVSADSLYRYASEGTLPAFRLGNRWRFKKSRLDQWMEEQSEAKPVRSRLKKPPSSQR